MPAISKLRQSLGMQGGHIRVPAISKLRQSQWHAGRSHSCACYQQTKAVSRHAGRSHSCACYQQTKAVSMACSAVSPAQEEGLYVCACFMTGHVAALRHAHPVTCSYTCKHTNVLRRRTHTRCAPTIAHTHTHTHTCKALFMPNAHTRCMPTHT